MTTTATKGFGTKLYIGGTGTPLTSGTVVEQISNLDLPEALAKMAEVTSHDSTKAEHIATYVDEGEIGVEMLYSAATEQEVYRALVGGAATQMYINLAGGTGKKQLGFLGIVQSFKLGTPLDGAVSASSKIKITGPVTWGTQG
jgi:hypothetical protein